MSEVFSLMTHRLSHAVFRLLDRGDFQERLAEKWEVVTDSLFRLEEMEVPESAESMHLLLVSAFHHYQEGLQLLLEQADQREALALLETGDDLLVEYEEQCEEVIDESVDLCG